MNVTCPSFWTGEVITGPKWVIKPNYPFTKIPVFVRPNSVLVLGPEGVQTPDYDYARTELEVRSYQIEQEVVVSVPAASGPKWGGKITVTKDGKVTSSGGLKLKK